MKHRQRTLDRATPWIAPALLSLALAAPATLLAPQPAMAQPQAAVSGLPDFTELVERVSPSVVNIRTSERRNGAAGGGNVDPGIEEFFRRFGIPMPNQRPGPRGGPRGEGEERPCRAAWARASSSAPTASS